MALLALVRLECESLELRVLRLYASSHGMTLGCIDFVELLLVLVHELAFSWRHLVVRHICRFLVGFGWKSVYL